VRRVGTSPRPHGHESRAATPRLWEELPRRRL